MIDEFLAGLRGVLIAAQEEAANPADVLDALAFGLAGAIARAKIPTEVLHGEEAMERALTAVADALLDAGTGAVADDTAATADTSRDTGAAAKIAQLEEQVAALTDTAVTKDDERLAQLEDRIAQLEAARDVPPDDGRAERKLTDEEEAALAAKPPAAPGQ